MPQQGGYQTIYHHDKGNFLATVRQCCNWTSTTGGRTMQNDENAFWMTTGRSVIGQCQDCDTYERRLQYGFALNFRICRRRKKLLRRPLACQGTALQRPARKEGKPRRQLVLLRKFVHENRGSNHSADKIGTTTSTLQEKEEKNTSSKYTMANAVYLILKLNVLIKYYRKKYD